MAQRQPMLVYTLRGSQVLRSSPFGPPYGSPSSTDIYAAASQGTHRIGQLRHTFKRMDLLRKKRAPVFEKWSKLSYKVQISRRTTALRILRISMTNKNRHTLRNTSRINLTIHLITQSRRRLFRQTSHTSHNTMTTQRHLITNFKAPINTLTKNLNNTNRQHTRRSHINTRDRNLSRTTKITRTTINSSLRMTTTKFIRMITTNLNRINSNNNRQNLRTSNLTDNKSHTTTGTSRRTNHTNTRRIRNDNMIKYTTSSSKRIGIMSRLLRIRQFLTKESILNKSRDTTSRRRIRTHIRRNKMRLLNTLQKRHTNRNSTNNTGLIRALHSRL